MADCLLLLGAVCALRVVAGLAEGSFPELEALVLPDMLRSAIISVMQVSGIVAHVCCDACRIVQ
jgi:hypothetical protein